MYFDSHASTFISSFLKCQLENAKEEEKRQEEEDEGNGQGLKHT